MSDNPVPKCIVQVFLHFVNFFDKSPVHIADVRCVIAFDVALKHILAFGTKFACKNNIRALWLLRRKRRNLRKRYLVLSIA